MILLISASKRLRKSCLHKGNGTLPYFIEEAKELQNVLKNLYPLQIKWMLKVNPRMGERIHKLYQNWSADKLSNGCWALELYHGTTYNAVYCDDWSDQEWDFAQEHVRIISGLYGLLRPKDTILPYRLEMHSVIPSKIINSLYDFWGNKLMNRLVEELKTHDDNIILNLASNEFAQAVVPHCPPEVKMITVQFLEYRNDKWKTIPVNAKKARGYMVRYVVKNNIKSLEDIKKFREMNFVFDAEASNENTFIFRIPH
jgi:cytoplasmic iron level regulating protein YaaA (DUF328/UPF0246 family)